MRIQYKTDPFSLQGEAFLFDPILMTKLLSLIPHPDVRILFLLSLIAPLAVLAQERTDSLERALEKASTKKEKARTLNELSSAWSSRDYQKALDLARKAKKLATEAGYQHGIAEAHHMMGVANDKKGNYDRALEHYSKALPFWKEVGDREKIATTYNNMGVVHYFQGNYPKAIHNYKKAIRIKEELGDQQALARTYNNIGIIHKDQGRYDKAIENYLKCLRIEEKRGDTSGIAGTYTNLGMLYHRQGDQHKALEHLRKSLEYIKDLGDKEGMANVLHNIGLAHEELENYQKALNYFKRSLRIEKELKNKKGIATSYGHIADLLLKIHKEEKGEFEAVDAHKGPLSEEKGSLLDSAEMLQRRSMAGYRSIGYREGLAHSYRSVGKIAHHKKRYRTAVERFKKASGIADSLGIRPFYFKVQKDLAKSYAALGAHDKAYTHHQEYARVKDSVINEERQEKIAQLEARFEAEKQKRRIKVLQKEKEKQKALAKAERQQDRAIIYSVSGGLLCVLILLGVLWGRFRVIRRQRDLLEEKTAELDRAYQKLEGAHQNLQEKSQEINDSIKYASFIQDAILPEEEKLSEVLGEHFTLLKPQATVSGDLYWCYGKEDRSLWAAVDCTGHGVPGAFMSMIAHSLLDETVIEKGERDPGRILEQLREGLAQKLGKSEQKDGMDLALCELSYGKDGSPLLRFAGANNPLYIIRDGIGDEPPEFLTYQNGEASELEEERILPFKNSSDGLIIRGDKRSIGFEERQSIAFTTFEFAVKEGDLLYCFSDGFPDQFGGPSGKKFRYSSFQELLLEIRKKPLGEQKRLLEERFEEWKGDHEQVDDVLVIGTRIPGNSTEKGDASS